MDYLRTGVKMKLVEMDLIYVENFDITSAWAAARKKKAGWQAATLIHERVEIQVHTEPTEQRYRHA